MAGRHRRFCQVGDGKRGGGWEGWDYSSRCARFRVKYAIDGRSGRRLGRGFAQPLIAKFAHVAQDQGTHVDTFFRLNEEQRGRRE